MGTANAIRRELDDAGELLTGEDAIEFLVESIGWNKAKLFSIQHNALVNGLMHDAPDYKRGEATGNPLYRQEDLLSWAALH